jgi:hypothetical protein
MSHKQDMHTIAEVELDTLELAAMSPPQARTSVAMQATESSWHVVSEEEVAALGTPLPAEVAESVMRAPGRGFLSNHALGIFGLVLIASAALVAHQVATSERVADRPTLAWTPLPERGAAVETADEQEEEVAPTPTLYANPFDPSEIFELAPGLTKEEARQQVAQILMERARERMASR